MKKSYTSGRAVPEPQGLISANDDEMEISLGERQLWLHLIASDIDHHSYIPGTGELLSMMRRASGVVESFRKLPLQGMDESSREMMLSLFKRTSLSRGGEYTDLPKPASAVADAWGADPCPGCTVRRRP
jgi:hypothetical protein